MTAIPYSSPLTYAAAPAAAASPLSQQHLAELAQAQLRAKKIRRAAAVATCDAYLSAAFAGLTLLSAILSPWSLVLGAALGFVAFNGFRGARMFHELNPAAPKLLALNQLFLAGTLIVYALISLWSAAHAGADILASAASAGPEVTKALGGFHLDQLYWLISLAIYGGLMIGTIFAQGLAAWYYFSRKKLLLAYRANTPQWILDLQKQQAGG